VNLAPQTFFIGLIDFVSILLPGALLTWLLIGEVGPAVLGDRHAALTSAPSSRSRTSSSAGKFA